MTSRLPPASPPTDARRTAPAASTTARDAAPAELASGLGSEAAGVPPFDVGTRPATVPPGTATARRAALRKLLIAGQAATQVELCRLLAERGFATTQSTISRDLKHLGAERRVRDDGELVYALQDGLATRFPADMVLAVDHNEAHIVVRTRVGRAPAVAIELDALRHPDILGTVAGDDTVLVLPRSIRDTQALAERLRELAHLPPAGGARP